jgi:hypothetical protein
VQNSIESAVPRLNRFDIEDSLRWCAGMASIHQFGGDVEEKSATPTTRPGPANAPALSGRKPRLQKFTGWTIGKFFMALSMKAQASRYRIPAGITVPHQF